MVSLLVLAFLSAVSADRVLGQAQWTDAQKIANAMTAAPSFISGNATIMEWQNGKAVTLRAGTNGWTCVPTNPAREGNEPMCLDDEWMSFMDALKAKAAPHVKRLGVGYMTAPGGAPGSNTDPFAQAATPDNEWGYDPPHVMLLAPDHHELQGIPTKRQSGGPWVMWAGTPYAHLMVPLVPPQK
ncbi:MAG TPA: hypothetical protein VEU55_03370 [Gemmatimonadales bacterium]|nr:hypothetical protein [Gemmatimonadales bacterium]